MANASEYTLYSGGLRGSEAEFGIQAEKWGVMEVNFSYDGHQSAFPRLWACHLGAGRAEERRHKHGNRLHAHEPDLFQC